MNYNNSKSKKKTKQNKTLIHANLRNLYLLLVIFMLIGN